MPSDWAIVNGSKVKRPPSSQRPPVGSHSPVRCGQVKIILEEIGGDFSSSSYTDGFPHHLSNLGDFSKLMKLAEVVT